MVAIIANQNEVGVFGNPRIAARERAGLSLDDVAAKVRISKAHIRQTELHGGCSFSLSQKLAKIYGCRMDLFLATKPTRKGSGRR